MTPYQRAVQAVQLKSGIVVVGDPPPPPKPTPEQRKQFRVFEFECGYLDEVIRFLKLLDERGAYLICAFELEQRSIRGNYKIVYRFHEEIGMEVKC